MTTPLVAPMKAFVAALAVGVAISTPAVADQRDAAAKAAYCVKAIDSHVSNPTTPPEVVERLTAARERWESVMLSAPVTDRQLLIISGRLGEIDDAQCWKDVQALVHRCDAAGVSEQACAEAPELRHATGCM